MTPLPSTAGDTGGRIAISLDGVPETMLWPLWHRVGLAETGRVPREELLDDPRAADLLRRINYDFVGRFESLASDVQTLLPLTCVAKGRRRFPDSGSERRRR